MVAVSRCMASMASPGSQTRPSARPLHPRRTSTQRTTAWSRIAEGSSSRSRTRSTRRRPPSSRPPRPATSANQVAGLLQVPTQSPSSGLLRGRRRRNARVQRRTPIGQDLLSQRSSGRSSVRRPRTPGAAAGCRLGARGNRQVHATPAWRSRMIVPRTPDARRPGPSGPDRSSPSSGSCSRAILASADRLPSCQLISSLTASDGSWRPIPRPWPRTRPRPKRAHPSEGPQRPARPLGRQRPLQGSHHVRRHLQRTGGESLLRRRARRGQKPAFGRSRPVAGYRLELQRRTARAFVPRSQPPIQQRFVVRLGSVSAENAHRDSAKPPRLQRAHTLQAAEDATQGCPARKLPVLSHELAGRERRPFGIRQHGQTTYGASSGGTSTLPPSLGASAAAASASLTANVTCQCGCSFPSAARAPRRRPRTRPHPSQLPLAHPWNDRSR